MSKRDTYLIRQRNAAIRKTFYNYLATGLSRMTAYAKTAGDYYLSEDRVREIVANRRV